MLYVGGRPMSRPLIASIVVAAALVALPALSWAKKAPPADAAEQTDKEKEDEKEKPKGKRAKPAAEDDAETHKKRAKDIGAEGKNLDKGKTKSGLDKLTGQVDALDKKLKEKGKTAPAEDPAPAKKGKKSPTT